jgi:hypothetical protein
MGRLLKGRESQKTCLDILHGEVFEDKTVKGVAGKIPSLL